MLRNFGKTTIGILQTIGGVAQIAVIIGVLLIAHGAAAVIEGGSNAVLGLVGSEKQGINFMQEGYKYVGRKIGGETGEKVANGVFLTVDIGLGVFTGKAALKYADDVGKINKLSDVSKFAKTAVKSSYDELVTGIKNIPKLPSKVLESGSKVVDNISKELKYLGKAFDSNIGKTYVGSNGAGEIQKSIDTLKDYKKISKVGKSSNLDEVGKIVTKGTSELDGVRIINKKYAGEVFELSGDLAKKYPDGVKFTKQGFPDFSPYSIKNVEVDDLVGDAYYDFIKANKAAGYKTTPKGFTWHHVEDGTTMMLVPSDLHSTVRHTGGASLIRKGIRP